MAAKVRSWIPRLGTDPSTSSADDFPPRHLEVVALVTQRLAQLDAGLDFFGRPPTWQPVFSFSYLREVARSFAQFAAQANREYVAFTQRAEDQTQTVQQMEQAVALGEAGIQIEATHVAEVYSEIQAASDAERLAIERVRLAEDNLNDYRDKGWDVVQLETAIAWSSAAVGGDDQWQRYGGLEYLGIGGDARRSDYLHHLAWQRSRRSYEIERDRLQNIVVELEKARTVAQSQSGIARSRLLTAEAAMNAARWRNQFARFNLAQARVRETSPELFFELARLVRDTAQTYLRRAIGVALAMEQAYNFENTTAVKRIRSDYGDLGAAGNLYAADFLLRDIDAFLYETVMQSSQKSQLVIRSVSLRREFPIQYLDFLRSGRMVFQTTLDQFHGDAPGTYNGRIRRVAIEFAGMTSLQGISGSLSCAGVSAVRGLDGTPKQKVHRQETMLLSPIASDRALSRLDSAGLASPPGEAAVFENVGLETSWLIDVPLRSNDVELLHTADVRFVVAYLCQHDPTLDMHDRVHTPTVGRAEIAFSLAQQGRDDNKASSWGQLEKLGDAELVLRDEWIPRNLKNPMIEDLSIFCVQRDARPLPLALRFGAAVDFPITVSRPDPDHITRIERSATPGPLHHTPVARTYRIAIDAAQNPLLASTKPDRRLDLSHLHDITIVISFRHDYR